MAKRYFIVSVNGVQLNLIVCFALPDTHSTDMRMSATTNIFCMSTSVDARGSRLAYLLLTAFIFFSGTRDGYFNLLIAWHKIEYIKTANT